jgi:hypothetical protein
LGPDGDVGGPSLDEAASLDEDAVGAGVAAEDGGLDEFE